MKLSILQHLSGGRFQLQLEPPFRLHWQHDIIEQEISPWQLLRGKECEWKQYPGGTVCFIHEEPRASLGGKAPQPTAREFRIIFPEMEIARHQLRLVLGYRLPCLTTMQLQLSQTGANRHLCPVSLGNGDFEFVDEPRQNMVKERIQSQIVYSGCDPKDERNSRLVVLFGEVFQAGA